MTPWKITRVSFSFARRFRITGNRGIDHLIAIGEGLDQLRKQDPFNNLFTKNKSLWNQLHLDLDYSTAVFDSSAVGKSGDARRRAPKTDAA